MPPSWNGLCRFVILQLFIVVTVFFKELNVERRRKRKAAETLPQKVEVDTIRDPLIKSLMEKEQKFVKMLTSTVAPIHSNLSESLDDPSTFIDFQKVRNSIFIIILFSSLGRAGKDEISRYYFFYNSLLFSIRRVKWAHPIPIILVTGGQKFFQLLLNGQNPLKNFL